MSAFCSPPPGMGPALWDDALSGGASSNSHPPAAPLKPKSPFQMRLEALLSGPFPVKVRVKVTFHYLINALHRNPGPFTYDAMDVRSVVTLLNRLCYIRPGLGPWNIPSFDKPLWEFTIRHRMDSVSFWDAEPLKWSYKMDMAELEKMYADFLLELIETAEERKKSLESGSYVESTLTGIVAIYYAYPGEWH